MCLAVACENDYDYDYTEDDEVFLELIFWL
jgi:hypothetical protein